MKHITKSIFLILFFFISFSAQASMQVKASIDSSNITIEQETQINVEVSGSFSVDDPLIPKVPGLRIIQMGRSSQLQIVNGSTSISALFMYRVLPMEEGSFTIPPFRVKGGGKEYKSNSLSLKVAKNHYTSKPKSVPDPYYTQQNQNNHSNQNTQGQSGVTVPQGENDLFWITTTVNRKKVYLSEQVLFYFKYYSRINPLDANLDMPQYKDFLNEVIVAKKQGHEIVNGRQYATFEKVIALFPTKKGTLTIEPAQLALTYQEADPRSMRGQWSPFFGRSVTKNVTLKSKPLTVEVMDLPQPIPANFSHLVGQFGMTAKLSDSEVEAGESVTLEVSYNGSGNIRSGILPALPFKDVKTYHDKPSLETYQSAQGISGRKTFKIVLVPQKPGEIKISELDYTYFDPKTKEYKPLKADEMVLTVLPSKSNNNQTHAILPQNGQTTQDDKQQIVYKDLAPLYAFAEGALSESSTFIGNRLFSVIFWGFPALFFMFFLGRRLKSSKKGPSRRQMKKQAFKKIVSQLNRKNLEADEALEIVQAFMSDAYDVEGQALTAREVKEVCVNRGVSQEAAGRLEKAIEELEASRYGFDKQTAVENAVSEILEVVRKGLKK